MDLAGRLHELEQVIHDAKSMPLSSSVLVSREDVLQMVQEMQENLPEEIKQARWIVKDREELLAKARAEADRIVELAHEEQRRMGLREEVAKRAAEEAERIVQEAEDKARTMQEEAEDYVDAKLAQFEIAIRRILEDSQTATRNVAKTLDQVELGREKLRAPTTAAEQHFGTTEPAAEAELYDDEDLPQT